MNTPHRQCLRPDLATIVPDYMRKRPLDSRGVPVPWFVTWVDSTPDLMTVDDRKFQLAMDKRRCWMCGHDLGKYATFLLDLADMICQCSAFPGSHAQCAMFSVKCHADIQMAMTHPDVFALWSCQTWQPFKRGTETAVVLGEPRTVTFWTQGRQATDREVMAAFWGRLSYLQHEAQKMGGDEPQRLAARVDQATFWLPDQQASA